MFIGFIFSLFAGWITRGVDVVFGRISVLTVGLLTQFPDEDLFESTLN